MRATLSIGGLLALAFLIHIRAKAQPAAEATQLLYPKTAIDNVLWPANRSSIWSVSGAGDSEVWGVVLRAKHQQVKKGEIPVLAATTFISKKDSDSEVFFGKLKGIKAGDTAIVGVQVIDLADIGAPHPDNSLRIRVVLAAKGASTSRQGIIVDGTQIVGQVRNTDLAWRNGELHLECIYIQSPERLTAYDVVVVKSAFP